MNKKEQQKQMKRNCQLIEILIKLKKSDTPYRQPIRPYFILKKPLWMLQNRYAEWILNEVEGNCLNN
jgi:hypothetical protein